jgi:hypothetical protein
LIAFWIAVVLSVVPPATSPVGVTTLVALDPVVEHVKLLGDTSPDALIVPLADGLPSAEADAGPVRARLESATRGTTAKSARKRWRRWPFR